MIEPRLEEVHHNLTALIFNLAIYYTTSVQKGKTWNMSYSYNKKTTQMTVSTHHNIM